MSPGVPEWLIGSKENPSGSSGWLNEQAFVIEHA